MIAAATIMETMTTTVQRAQDRFHTKIDWLDSWHSFSFGGHFDRNNTHHGQLLVVNDDVIAPAGGSAPIRTATWRSSRGCSTAPSSTRTRKATTGSSSPGSRSA